MIPNLLLTGLWALLFSLFVGAEMAFAFFNRLRLELVNDEHFRSKIHPFFFKHAADFSNILYVVHFVCFFFFLRQIYVSICQLPLLQACGIALAALAIVVIFTDLFLRAINSLSANSVFNAISYPLSLVYWILLPFCKLLVFILTLGGLIKTDGDWAFSINRIYQEHEENGTDTANDDENQFGDEIVMFQNALDFSNLKVKDSMVPRTEIVAIDIDTSLEDLKNLFVESHFSRILVYRDTIDNVLGYVHSADMFDGPQSVEEMLNPVLVVPENMAANNMLRLFLKQKKSLALVVDEFGGTSGLLTIEDVMEEIFGEIEDEHDTDEENDLVSKQIGPNEYVVSGRMEIEQVNEELHLDLPLGDDYLTVGGLLLSRNAFLPAVGDVVNVGDKFSFKVVRRSPSHIDVVRLTVNQTTIVNH